MSCRYFGSPRGLVSCCKNLSRGRCHGSWQSPSTRSPESFATVSHTVALRSAMVAQTVVALKAHSRWTRTPNLISCESQLRARESQSAAASFCRFSQS